MASTHHEDYRLLIQMARETREGEGVAQSELATRLGVTQTFISKMERGERRLDPVELVEILEALGVVPAEWITDYLQRRDVEHRHHVVERKISS
jgi:transcriptional regulator with XRE-family HTH domain